MYLSIGLSPGTAAFQVATRVAVVAPTAVQRAVTPGGADGTTEAAAVVTLIGVEAGLEPPIVVFTTVIWYVVWGCSGPISPLVAGPLTFVVRIGAVELTGVAVKAEDIIASGLTPFGIHETWN